MNVTPRPEASPTLRCRRCGQCCLRGGPTLMREDAPLLESGTLPVEALVCLRRGEWARDDAQGVLRPLDRELIKVAGASRRHRQTNAAFPWQCPYYVAGTDAAGCGIYARRPAQCRVLFCADTGPLEDLLARGQSLDRRAVLAALPGLDATARSLWAELAAAHEEQCPARSCLEAARSLGFCPRSQVGAAVREPMSAPPANEAARRAAVAALTEAARCDAAFRELCAGRGGVPAAALPFLLGRPLTELLAEVGLRAVRR